MSLHGVRGVVVAYNGDQQLDSCLSVLANEIEVTVVDNSSSAKVRNVAAAYGAHYLDSGANLGFAAGVNLGLAAVLAGPPCDVLLLNPDALVEPEALRGLYGYLHRGGNDRIAATAPRLHDAAGRRQRVAWPFPSPLRAWLEAFGLGGLPVHRGFVIGAVLLLRWEAIQDVGLFDDRFFLYAEEADWQRRAAASGWLSSLCPEVAATHVGAGASDDPARRELLFHAAQEIYIRKWYGRVGWLSYRVAAWTGATGRTAILRGDRRAEAARRARLYARGPRRCAAAFYR